VRIKQTLDDLITLRGEIAHRVVSSRSVKKHEVTDAANLGLRLAATSSNTMRRFLMTRVNEEPWEEFELRTGAYPSP
jgi:hypothetical protein